QEQQQLAVQPTKNVAAYDAYLRAEAMWLGGGGDPKNARDVAALHEQAVKLDPSFALAWARLSLVRSFMYGSLVPDPALARGAREAAERALQLSPGLPEGRVAMASYFNNVGRDSRRALEQCTQGLAVDRSNAELLRLAAVSEQSLGRWDEALAHAQQARSLDPRSVRPLQALGTMLLWQRRYPQAAAAFDDALAIAPKNVTMIEFKAVALLGQGDLPGARALLQKNSGEVSTDALLSEFGLYWDLMWLFDEAQTKAFLQLPLEAFGGARGARSLAFAQTYALQGKTAEMRKAADEAERAFTSDLAATPDDDQTHILRGLALAYLGRREEAIQEGERGLALRSAAHDAYSGAYNQHQLVRIYMVLGEKEKALDSLEQLLKAPYYLSPAWLGIDPNFAPLKGHPRFEALRRMAM
ncbi:MAG: tetratricopeptide repeat protein, partial [Bryobacteraceae bacterium]